MKCYLYWLHLPEYTNPFSEGYIGITTRPKRRLYEHRIKKENSHLENAFIKYNNIQQTILLVGSKEYCLYIEKVLRFTDHIGWNITKGGGSPPTHKGVKKSIQTRLKMKESRKTVKFSSEACKNISLSKSKENHPYWGKTLSDDHRRKLRESNINKPRLKKTTCDHCGKSVDNANFARHHGDRCKYKGEYHNVR